MPLKTIDKTQRYHQCLSLQQGLSFLELVPSKQRVGQTGQTTKSGILRYPAASQVSTSRRSDRTGIRQECQLKKQQFKGPRAKPEAGSRGNRCLWPLVVAIKAPTLPFPSLKQDLSAQHEDEECDGRSPRVQASAVQVSETVPGTRSRERQAEGEKGVPGYIRDYIIALGDYYGPRVQESYGRTQTQKPLESSFCSLDISFHSLKIISPAITHLRIHEENPLCN